MVTQVKGYHASGCFTKLFKEQSFVYKALDRGKKAARELTDDTIAFARKNPGKATGIAASLVAVFTLVTLAQKAIFPKEMKETLMAAKEPEAV